MKKTGEPVLVLDFGGQYAHLICRRVRELGVYAELIPHNISSEELKSRNPKGLIFSGGPASVYDKHAPKFDRRVLSLGKPILGICYGLQLIVHHLGGKVEKASKREFGRTELFIDDDRDLFAGVGKKFKSWMSHGDKAEELPPNFEVIGHSLNSKFASIRHPEKKLYAVQFHPEVSHTPKGVKILGNFLFNICDCKKNWRMSSFVEGKTREIKEMVGEERVLCAVSGGVDSSTTAALIHRAVRNQLVCIFVDHGLLRKGEADEVKKLFKEHLKIETVTVNASSRFLSSLHGVVDPEEKRKIIGETFVKVFTEEGRKLGHFVWLAQGTLYPDVIESAATSGPASRIKTHHNVAGFPGWAKFKLLEPLRDLYKDEVRKVARILGMPEALVRRHPFPGPGLSVRIIGEITPEKLMICRGASAIVEEELLNAGLYDKVWQAFASVGDDRATGVQGDERKYGHIVTVRIVSSLDSMTANWVRVPYGLLERISSRITNEIPGVTWVNYAVSNKPPSTIEPQ